jgi:hypothetical protein
MGHDLPDLDAMAGETEPVPAGGERP